MNRHLSASLFVVTLAAAASAQTVEELWKANCMMCHRAGEGGAMNTPTLLTDAAFDQSLDRRFFDAIKNGKPGTSMKGFSQKLGDEQAWALVNHIRELQLRNIRKVGGQWAAPKPTNGVYATRLHSYKIEDFVASGLSGPWAIEFLPQAAGGEGGGAIITEKDGSLRLFQKGKLSEPITGTPEVVSNGQGGLLDVALHPDYASNGWIYLSFSDPRAGKEGRKVSFTKIVRGKIRDKAWVDQETIFAADPEHYSGGDIHFGCRFVFPPKGKDGKQLLYFCIGERGRGELAQNLNRPNGKVYRVFDDGTIPTDNPFVDQGDAYKAIWSYGHRNPQGLVMDQDGNLFDTEHGPRGGDELNLVTKGANYGWPIVSYGINYNGQPNKTPWPTEQQNFLLPVARWMPSIAACGLTVASDKAFPKWNNDLFAGGLAGARQHRPGLVDARARADRDRRDARHQALDQQSARAQGPRCPICAR
jgi:glucose/arabinose dehydrogenase/cytochrome c5